MRRTSAGGVFVEWPGRPLKGTIGRELGMQGCWGIGTRPSRGWGVQCPRLRLRPVVCLGGGLSVKLVKSTGEFGALMSDMGLGSDPRVNRPC